MNNNSRLKIINWKNVYENYGDNFSFLQDVFSELQIEIKNEIKELKEYIFIENYQKIYLSSHKIKGALCCFFCDESSYIIEDICIISKKGTTNPSKEKMIQIVILFDDFYKSYETLNYEIDSCLFKKK